MVDTAETTATRESSQEEMTALYETTMKSLQEGDNLLKGKVLEVGTETAIVDVGLKSEGKVPLSEFMDKNGVAQVNVGDEVEVLIVGREKEFGLLLLSKQRADGIRTWKKINKSFEEGDALEGEVVSEVKGGFMVDLTGVKAFLPISQVDVKPVKNAASFVGRHLKFRAIKVNQRKGNVVISRRVLIDEERQRKREEFWKTAKEGQVVYGLVRNVTDFGAFVDLGGVDGFLHINDITWGRITHPKEYLRVGDEIKVKVKEIDQEKEKVSVTVKDLKADPWISIDEKYPAGSKAHGKIVGVVEYGAFVELEQGVEGLLHVSEMSWDRRLRNPGKVVKKGEWIDVMVLDLDQEKKRISLGLRQLLPDPWDELETKYPTGSVVKGRVKNFTDFGMFLGIGDGVDGLVHMSEISWSRRKRPLNEVFKKGATLEARVLNVDKEQKKFSLSLKRMHDDPWKGLGGKYRTGDVVDGFVTSITDFGVFVEIEEGVEGLIHVSEMDEAQGRHPSEIYKLDDPVKAVVLNIDEKERRIGLSTKALKKHDEKQTIESFTVQETSFSTLGDILGEAMRTKNGEESAD